MPFSFQFVTFDQSLYFQNTEGKYVGFGLSWFRRLSHCLSIGVGYNLFFIFLRCISVFGEMNLKLTPRYKSKFIVCQLFSCIVEIFKPFNIFLFFGQNEYKTLKQEGKDGKKKWKHKLPLKKK